MNNKTRNYLWWSLIGLFLCFFATITYLTPLAGDDWGYALNGMSGNPLLKTWEFYFSWSGRLCSELWGFVVAPRKWLWNVLNPLLFTAIVILMNKIIQPKKNSFAVLMTILFLVISVKDYVRMETYTWIMGTTYVLPLFWMLLYFYFAKELLFNDNKTTISSVLMVLANIIVPISMENAAATLLFANILLVIYSFFRKKECVKWFMSMLLISMVGIVILRSSPGSIYRLKHEHADFTQLSLFEQIQVNWPTFIRLTFLDNKWLIMIFSLCIVGFSSKNSTKKSLSLVASVVVLLGIIPLVKSSINEVTALIPLTILYILYVIAVIVIIVIHCSDDDKWLALFLLLVGGTANLVMCISPIFGSRSSLYTIYMLICLTAFFVDKMTIKYSRQIIIAFMVIMVGLKGRTILNKYQLVNMIQKERMQQIAYYQDHPEVKEAWIVRMPVYSIHSGDIEEWDHYHMEVFKEYYHLDKDVVLNFYWKEKY